MNRALSILCVFAFCAPAAASPSAKSVAQKFADGSLAPEKALKQWGKSGVEAEEALKLLSTVRRKANKTRNHTIKLVDGFGRKSVAHVIMPSTPRDDGTYGIMVALHGLGGNARQLVPFVTQIAPKGTIVICPGAQRLAKEMENEDVPGVGLSSRLPHWWSYKASSFVLKSLDYVKRNYPIDTNRVYLLGYSMGGYGTWNIGLRYTDRFAGIVPLAGGISRLENFLGRDTRSRKLIANGVMVPAWFAHGGADRTVPTRFSRTIAKELGEFGATYFFKEVPGSGHMMRNFLRGDELTEQLVGWLGEQVRDPNPKRVELATVGLYHGASYWVRIDESNTTAKVSAEVKDNSFAITTEGVRKLTIFLDTDLVDVNAPVTINVGGIELFKGVVESSLEAVTESWSADLDPHLTYTHKVELDLVQ